MTPASPSASRRVSWHNPRRGSSAFRSAPASNNRARGGRVRHHNFLEIRRMRKLTLPVRLRRMAGCVLIATVAFPASACKDLLKVEDPQTFGNQDLDDPNILAAVADGVEGIFQQTFDDALVYAGLMSDELED